MSGSELIVIELTRLFRHSSKSVALKDILSPKAPLFARRSRAEMMLRAGEIVGAVLAALTSSGVVITSRRARKRTDNFFINVTVPFSNMMYFAVYVTIFASVR